MATSTLATVFTAWGATIVDTSVALLSNTTIIGIAVTLSALFFGVRWLRGVFHSH